MRVQVEHSIARTILGSARVSRVGCDVAPQQSFLEHLTFLDVALSQGKVRDSEDTVASTRDACATQISAITPVPPFPESHTSN
jgi:hypothetical protein